MTRFAFRSIVFGLVFGCSLLRLAVATESTEEPASAASAPVAPTSPDAPSENKPESDIQLVSGTEPANKSDVKQAGDEDAKQLPSDAERIARLERSIESDRKRLRELKESLHTPEGEYDQAEAAFRDLDAQRNDLQKRIAAAQQQEASEELAQLQEDLGAIEKKWTLAKERFELAISERKAGQENLATLERKLESDRETLEKLNGAAQPEKLVSTPPPAPAPASPAPAALPPAQPPVPEPAAPTVADLSAAVSPLPGINPLATASAPPATPASPAPPAPTATSKKRTAELEAAAKAAEESRLAAAAAEEEARSIAERIEILSKDIEQQRSLRETARKKVENADQTLKGLNEELFRKLMAGENIEGLKPQIEETTSRLLESRDQSRDINTHLDHLQSTLVLLQSDQLAATNDALRKQEAADKAQATVEELEYPFTLRNLLQWLIDHGPRIVKILLSLSVLLWLSRILETRLVGLIARRGRRGSREDRENRAKTLLGVFNNVANLLIVGGCTATLLDEVGIPITPVIGGAAVLGLAVAFGAQSLIKDYFTGFMVLFEQQYLINDVVRIGEITGQVERISLRMTVLRDLEGRVHFIPHGQINTVTNLTHGWSRAVFEVGVAYKESVDQVIAVLKKLAADLRQDENYRFLILDEPVMLGVDSLDNSAVIIKFYIQTRPLQQWTVKREMLRRIKNEFDRLGIEIPFPHVTVYHGVPKEANTSDHSERWGGSRDVA